MKNASDKKPLPDDLVGVFVNDGSFICKNCLGDDDDIDDIDDEDKFTVVLRSDEWFEGADCSRCYETSPPQVSDVPESSK